MSTETILASQTIPLICAENAMKKNTKPNKKDKKEQKMKKTLKILGICVLAAIAVVVVANKFTPKDDIDEALPVPTDSRCDETELKTAQEKYDILFADIADNLRAAKKHLYSPSDFIKKAWYPLKEIVRDYESVSVPPCMQQEKMYLGMYLEELQLAYYYYYTGDGDSAVVHMTRAGDWLEFTLDENEELQ